MEDIPPVYKPLSGTEVRFIKLQSGRWNEPIRCDLITLPMTEAPCYIALSYVWGDPYDTLEVLLNGRLAQVTVNLFAALRQLRHFLLDPSDAPDVFNNDGVLFWVDALCVNQFDIKEKSKQVPRMGAIYSSAELVVAWLGENGEMDSMTGRIMDIAHQIHNSTPESFVSDFMDPFTSQEFTEFLEAFEDLLNRPWFYRVWVVQEVVLAQSDPIFLAGPHWCTVNRLRYVWTSVYHSKNYYDMMGTSLLMGYNLGIYSNLGKFINQTWTVQKRASEVLQNETERSQDEQSAPESDENGGQKPHMDSLLSNGEANVVEKDNESGEDRVMVQTLACVLSVIVHQIPFGLYASVPHDYIYGLLSMANAPYYPEMLVPDYSIPFSNVFHAYTKIILENTGSLSIIPRYTNRLEGVPTWVPDFRSGRTDEEVKLGLMPTMDTGVRISEDGRVCITEGVHLGEVIPTDLYKSGQAIDYEAKVLKRICGFNALLEDICKIKQLDKEDAITTCLNGYFGNNRDFSYMTRVRELYDCAVSGVYLPSLSSKKSQDKAIFEMFDLLLRDESVFSVSCGIMGRINKTDESPKKGDVLAMLKGAQRPFLLRPTDVEREYTFLGSCWTFIGKSQFGVTEEYFARSKVETFRLI